MSLGCDDSVVVGLGRRSTLSVISSGSAWIRLSRHLAVVVVERAGESLDKLQLGRLVPWYVSWKDVMMLAEAVSHR
jgi:hypothetical protein